MYSNISDIISASQNADLLSFMNSYWLPNSGSPESFWEHEWNKHGTCINTLAPSCYGDGYQPGDEVVDFFNKAVDTFKVSLRDSEKREFGQVLMLGRVLIPTKLSLQPESFPLHQRPIRLMRFKPHLRQSLEVP
jgi:Ribonuclease T2 family